MGFNHLYGFSISEYRNIYDLAKDEMVDIYVDSIYSAYFEGKNDIALDLSYVQFHAKDDVAGIAFSGSVFSNGIIDISYSCINDLDLCFSRCVFNQTDIKFTHTIFGNQDLLFLNAKLGNTDISFDYSIFGRGEISFFESEGLNGTVQFTYVQFDKRNIDFTYMKNPHGQFVFVKNELLDSPVDFANSFVDLIVMYYTNINIKIDLSVATANYITVQDCVNRDCILIGNSGYKNITYICLKDTINLGRIDILNKFCHKLFSKQKQFMIEDNLKQTLFNTSYLDKSKQLIMIKENFRSMGDYDNEDYAYLLSKRYENLSRIQERLISFRSINITFKKLSIQYIYHTLMVALRLIVESALFVIELVFLDFLCGNYATKPFRFILSMIILILGFGAVYYGISESAGLYNSFYFDSELLFNSNSLAISMYLSIVSFFQLNIIDVTPLLNSLQILNMCERMLGLTMFALFTVSFTRKVIK